MSTNLRALRIERRLTQHQLAAQVGICSSHLSQIEGGQRCPSIGCVVRLLVALQAPPAVGWAIVEELAGLHAEEAHRGRHAGPELHDNARGAA